MVITLNKVTPVKVQTNIKVGILVFLFSHALANHCEVQWLLSPGWLWSLIKLLGWKYQEPLYSPLNHTKKLTDV